jgi:miniconductance mechanosensitive channel
VAMQTSSDLGVQQTLTDLALFLLQSLDFDTNKDSIALGLILLWALGLVVILSLLQLIRVLVERGIHRSASEVGALVIQRGLLKGLLWLIPPIYSYLFSAGLVTNPAIIGVILTKVTLVLVIVTTFLLISRMLSFVAVLYMRNDLAKERPITGYIQISQAFFWIVAAILVFSVISNQEPWGFLSGIGALSAIILLIFRDSLLGLMASIQLTTNHMVKIGDWIEMNKFGADGEVVEINLQSVKVRNWDMTFTTIPIYALVSDSFRNWRGMSESGGRRVKKSVVVDLRDIHFLSKEQRQSWETRSEAWIKSALAAGSACTNLTLYRNYLVDLIAHHPGVNTEMAMAVRLLEPIAQGVPVEIVFFCKEKKWPAFEQTYANVLEQSLASLNEFGLRAYQAPGADDYKGERIMIKQ